MTGNKICCSIVTFDFLILFIFYFPFIIVGIQLVRLRSACFNCSVREYLQVVDTGEFISQSCLNIMWQNEVYTQHNSKKTQDYNDSFLHTVKNVEIAKILIFLFNFAD